MPKQSAPTAEPTSASAARPVRRKTDVRESILLAAERLFAEHGFNGCSLRDVADLAKVNQGMIHYFFKTKETLFVDAYMRCGRPLVDERLRLLDEEEVSAKGKPIRVDRLIELFLEPAIVLAMRGVSGKSFLRMQARLQMENNKFSNKLRRTLYDESSRRFVEAFGTSLPNLSREEICWRFIFILGAYQYALASTGRIEAISEGTCSGKDFKAVLREIVPFLAAGMRAPRATGSADATRRAAAAKRA